MTFTEARTLQTSADWKRSWNLPFPEQFSNVNSGSVNKPLISSISASSEVFFTQPSLNFKSLCTAQMREETICRCRLLFARLDTICEG